MKLIFEDTIYEILFYFAVTLYTVVGLGEIAYKFGESLALAYC